MAKTYCTCRGMRQQAHRTGGNNGCKASVQSYDGSVIVENWYDENNDLMIRVSLDEGSSSCGTTVWQGKFDGFKEAMELLKDVKEGKASVTRHREKSNKMKQLERMFEAR